MDKDELMSIIKLDDLPASREEKSKLNGRIVDLTYDLLPSTTDENIENNIKVLEKVEDILKEITQQYKVDLSKIFDTFRFYKESFTLHKAVQEETGVPEPLVKSLLIKYSTNSVIRISQPLNYEQIKNLARLIFSQSKEQPLIFAIPDKDKIVGKVIGEIEQKKVKLPLAWKTEVTIKEITSYLPYVFGEKVPKRAKIVDEISGEFFLYRFLSKEKKEYALVSKEPLRLDDYTIHGLNIEVEDFKIIGDAYRLINKFPVFFVHTANSHVCQLEDHKQLFDKADELKLTGNKLYSYLSSHKKKGEIQVLEHPLWFMQIITSFLFHKAKGTTSEYPVHFLWIADRGTGKSSLLEALHQKSGESQEIVAGSSSTLKYLIPSFKESNRPEMGALAKASRLIIIDEFFRILRVNIKDKEDECGRMNDLLEHKDRQAGSGQGKIRTSMTARLIAATNPIAGTNNIINLVEKFDDSFLSRFLIYYQSEDHVKFIHKRMKEGVHATKDWIEVNDFLSIQDYLQSFDALYKRERAVKIFEKFLVFLSQDIKGMYEARYLHHLECILDGIIKIRCLLTRDSSFTAKEEDYADAEAIWARVIKSWFRTTIDDLLKDEKIAFETRVKFLPEEATYILRVLETMGYSANLTALKEKCRQEMSPVSLSLNLSLLREGNFIIEKGAEVFHYAYAEVDEK